MKRSLLEEGLIYAVGTSKEIANYKGKLSEKDKEDFELTYNIGGNVSEIVMVGATRGVVGTLLAVDVFYRMLKRMNKPSANLPGLIGVAREKYQSATKKSKK